MKAMILAAGLGTRLRPLTDSMPKALVVVNGASLLEHSLNHLRKHGIREVIINVHHFAGQVIDFLGMNNDFGMEITISDETGELLDTGGGLKNAAWFFDDKKPFLLRNVDVLSDLDLGILARYHEQDQALATLVVRERDTTRYLLFDLGLRLSGWVNIRTDEKKVTRTEPGYVKLAFSGIQVIDPAIFPLVTETGQFSLTDMYLRLSAGHTICGFLDRDSCWKDAGKEIPVNS